MDHVVGLDVHAAQPDDDLQGGRELVPPLETEHEASMGDGGVALVGLLVGDVHDVSGSDRVQQVLFAPHQLLLSLALDHLPYIRAVVFDGAQGRDLVGAQLALITPDGQPGLAELVIWLLAGDPVGVVRGRVKHGLLFPVSEHDALFESQGQLVVGRP